MPLSPPQSVAGVWESGFGPVTLVCQPFEGGRLLAVTGSWTQAGKVGRIQSGHYDPATGALAFDYFLPWSSVSGKAEFQFANDLFVGTWQQGGAAPGSGSWILNRQAQDAELLRFFAEVRSRLLGNETTPYTELAPVPPVDLAVVAQGVGDHPGVGRHVLAFTDARYSAEAPGAIFERTRRWYSRAIGVGSGVLIFVYAPPIEPTVDVILNGFSVSSSIAIYGGVYDVISKQHKLRSSLDVEHDIFGDSR